MGTMKMLLREPGTPGHALQIQPLESFHRDDGLGRMHFLKELAELFCALFKRDDVHDVMRLIAEEQQQGHRYLVMTLDGRIVGFANWRPWGEGKDRLAQFFHIGTSLLGAGPRLVEALEQDAHAYFRRQGLPGVRMFFLLVREDKPGAANLYRRHCGYRASASIPGIFGNDTSALVFQKFA